MEAENAGLKATAEAATAALNQHKREAMHAEHAAFAESLVKAGKLDTGGAGGDGLPRWTTWPDLRQFAEGDQQKPPSRATREAPSPCRR